MKKRARKKGTRQKGTRKPCSGSISPIRNYKDTVFRMLFHEKKELLTLYNAANGTGYTDPDDLEITTLGNAIYLGMKNDLSFVMDLWLNLYEQQSTLNPNMPLRDLMYIVRILEKLINQRTLYSTKRIQLPNPHFIVFYNGMENQPERKQLRLSDSFYRQEEKPELELIVTQLNINPGFNEDLKEKCPTLAQYMLYVDRVRRYEKDMLLAQAVEQAVDECIQEGILADFLRKNKAEVISMSIFEYDEELYHKTIYEEAIEEGLQKGYDQGYGQGLSEGRSQGLSEGRSEGRSQGFSQGLGQGAELKLISQVCRKLRKNKTPESIAEELDENLDTIVQICAVVGKIGIDCDAEKVYQQLHSA